MVTLNFVLLKNMQNIKFHLQLETYCEELHLFYKVFELLNEIHIQFLKIIKIFLQCNDILKQGIEQSRYNHSLLRHF